MDFKSVLSQKRLPVPTPDDIIDENGKAVFGTFESEFPKMSFLNVKGQSNFFPNWYNSKRLTLWEAVEVNLKDVVLLTAPCNMGILAKALTILYDKKTQKVTYWAEDIPTNKVFISDTLLKGDTSEAFGKVNKLKIINHFESGRAFISGTSEDKKNGSLKYDIALERVSLPSIVSFPLGDNKPLYTQKDLFKVEGYVEFNGVRYEADEDSTAIIDDHRGYYPLVSHYDWVTTMGKLEIDGEKRFFGINLTRNQSLNQTDYNENLIWFEGRTSRVTPVRFEHIDYNTWHIRDVYGMVDIIFRIRDRYLLRMPYVVIDANYHVTFGDLEGYICDEDGNRYCLDGMTAIGEDKSLRI